ncbi:MAG: CHAT domain-containing protein [Saprospiraceae bacterium]|nr:CHAT domain-containing protein [Saprospiraceae bacterium]
MILFRRLFIAIILTFSGLAAAAQQPDALLSSVNQLIHFADSLNENDNPDMALMATSQALKALEVYDESRFAQLRATTYLQAGIAYSELGQFNLADSLFTLALTNLDKETSTHQANTTADAWRFIAINHLQAGKFKEAMRAALQSRQSLEENDPRQGSTTMLIGHIYKEQSDYKTALTYYDQAILQFENSGTNKSKGYTRTLRAKGESLCYLNKYEEGVHLLESALSLAQQLFPANHSEIGTNYIKLGVASRRLNRLEEALEYLNKALHIFSKKPVQFYKDQAYTYSELTHVYLALQQPDKALQCALTGISILEYQNGTDDPNLCYTYHDLGKTYFNLKRYPESAIWQQKAIDNLKKQLPDGENGDLASLYLWLARAKSGAGDFDGALNALTEDRRIMNRIVGSDFVDLHREESVAAQTFLKWHLKTGQANLLDSSLQYFGRSENGFIRQMQRETSSSFRRRLLSDAVPSFENAIHAAYLAFQIQHDDSMLENAWRLSESMHGYLLRTSAQEANAKRFAGIPESLLQQDSLARATIARLEKTRYEMLEYEGKNLSDSAILQLNSQIFNQRKTLLTLISRFEKEHPEYYRLKYDQQSIGLKALQSRLTSNQTLLEYFTGDSSIFVFIVQQNSASIRRLPRDFPLKQWVADFRSGVYGYHTTPKPTPQLYEQSTRQYAESALHLYEKLIKPFEKELKSELIIVPSEELANLPFEALLVANPKDLSSFAGYPFLVRQKAIHYAYSATFMVQLMDKQHRKKPEGNLLAMAPYFFRSPEQSQQLLNNEATRRFGLGELPYSGEEVIRAQKQIGVQSVIKLGAEADKAVFESLAPDFKMLHLATHGKANAKDGSFSFIAFAADKAGSQDGLLTAGELYNFNLNADVVLLSACETGIGEVQRGEGISSLARAFAYAGAKCIISSLWSVNDRSTMELVDHFYGELKKGKPKNLALANAKRMYLDQNPGRQSHPFFWAGMVAVGDMK